VDGKTCRQELAADGSPVQMLNVFLQQVRLTLDQWSIGGTKRMSLRAYRGIWLSGWLPIQPWRC
jgi:hypothetical protein